ncbi:hypothetical protein ACFL3C_02335 [Patescibacteria group bacterium]
MTENQKNLIIFIYKYQSENEIIPSLGEMVAGINVSDNKSVLRAIESLIKKGYLAQIGAKTSAVIPTYKALKELDLHPLKPYTLVGDNTKIEQPRDLAQDTVTTTLESGFIPPLGADIKSDGTQFDSNQLKKIVQNAVNLAFSNSLTEKSSIFGILKNIPITTQSEWTILAILLLGFSVFFIGADILAIIATCGILFTVFIISNLSK